MPKVQLLCFGTLKKLSGIDEQNWDLAPGTRLSQLFEKAESLHPIFKQETHGYKIALNEDFPEQDLELKDGDTVAFIPPMCGGVL